MIFPSGLTTTPDNLVRRNSDEDVIHADDVIGRRDLRAGTIWLAAPVLARAPGARLLVGRRGGLCGRQRGRQSGEQSRGLARRW
jgi:hypothetical protein